MSSHPLSPIPIKVLVSSLNFHPSILHTSPSPALTQSTSPLNSEPPFDNSNFICLLVLSPNVKSTYTLIPSRISWHLTPCTTHSPFTLKTSGKTMWFGLQIVEILNHVPTFSRQEHNIYQTTCPHSTNHLQHHSAKGYHDTLYGSIGLQLIANLLWYSSLSQLYSNIALSSIHW